MSFQADANTVIQALLRYQAAAQARQEPVIKLAPLETIIRDLDLGAWVQDGGLTDEHLQTFIATYLSYNTRLQHPAFLAHQVAVPHYASALGALISGFTNNAMAIYEMGPGASSIEYYVLNWMLTQVGWTPMPTDLQEITADSCFGGGVLMHGGSLSNLVAMLVARHHTAPEAWQEGNPPDLALLAPAGAHYSVARAAGIMGLGQQALYELDVDARGAIRPDRLEACYQQLRNDGKRAIALVANACSTAVGVYDPLDDIGDFCAEHDLWFHVDGAHGASALLSPTHRAKLKGIEKAHSLTWDAHKLMQTSVLCAALLVRDHRHLDVTFQQKASYLFHEKQQPGFDFIQRTVECTKSGLGLKFYLTLAALGKTGLANTIDHLYAQTQAAYQFISTQPDFTCPVAPESNILCFRIEGSDHDQLTLRDQLIARGDYYLSTTQFNDITYLRLVIINPQTTLEDIQHLIETLRQLHTTPTD